MSTASMHMRKLLVESFFRHDDAGFVQPTQLWVALTKKVPEANASSGQLEEPVGGGYARDPYPINAASWASTGYGEVYNTVAVIYNAVTADWGVIVGWALCDTAAGDGNTYAVGSLVNPTRAVVGMNPTVNAGGIVFGLYD